MGIKDIDPSESFNALLDWYGSAESDAEAIRRAIGSSRQYMARKAEYKWHRDHNNKVSANIVEVTVLGANGKQHGRASVHKTVFDSRPRDTENEVTWACKVAGCPL
jgi:hypothetical protein